MEDRDDLDDRDRLLAWRTQYALDLGYPLGTAVELADSPIDLHELERLIRKGAGLDLARRIAGP
jgi:hypothetical protein